MFQLTSKLRQILASNSTLSTYPVVRPNIYLDQLKQRAIFDRKHRVTSDTNVEPKIPAIGVTNEE